MTLKISTQTADMMLSALSTALNGGKINIYSGTEPATANAAISGANVLLAQLTFGNPAFGAISSSGNDRFMNAEPIAQDSAANATGDASFFRATNTAGNIVYYQGTIGTTGQQLNLTALNIVTDGVVQVSSMSITMPTA